MKRETALTAALAGMLVLPGAAAAQDVFVTTDLNLRAGPGPDFPVITAITSRQSVTVYGCTESRRWCEIDWGGDRGWAYAEYLAFRDADDIVVIADAGDWLDLPVISYRSHYVDDDYVVTGGAFVPPPRIRTYVIERGYEPVYIEEEIVLGFGLPDFIELYPVPDYDYHYAVVNEYPLLVDPYTREIVYIFD